MELKYKYNRLQLYECIDYIDGGICINLSANTA